MIAETKKVLFLSTLTISLAGCMAPAQVMVGKAPSATPPQLLLLATPEGKAKGIYTWDNPLAFGPVPSQLQVAGNVSCMIARIDLQAIGYHPAAKGRDEVPLQGGGFFCGPKPHGAQPAKTPPKLIHIDGVLGWDNPAAFGLVPDTMKEAGANACGAPGRDNVAYGYHPGALDENGSQIPGGGFFCVSATALKN